MRGNNVNDDKEQPAAVDQEMFWDDCNEWTGDNDDGEEANTTTPAAPKGD